MPTLHNPSGVRLACYRIARFLEPDERVEISEEDAAALEHGSVFQVERGEKAPEAAHEAPVEAEEPKPEPKTTPQRKSAKRGSKRAEVTKAPKRETR